MTASAARVRLEAGDVLGDRAVEQLDVLRQVADMAAERVGLPLVEGGAVEADLAAQGRPDADEGARQGRLAGGARPDEAEALAGLHLERRRPARSAAARPGAPT